MALDLDGTVLDRDLSIHPSTITVLKEVLASGRRVTIVTGRMFTSARKYAEQLGLGDMPLVAYNGALIRTAVTANTFFHQPVDLAVARGVAELAAGLGYSLNLYVDDQLIVAEVNDKAQFYMTIAGVEAHPVGDLVAYLGRDQSRRPTKMLVVDEETRIQDLKRAVGERFGKDLYAVTSYPYFLEMMNPGVSKSKALGALARGMGVARDEILAVGDSFNDLDMLEYAGVGVAMGSAPEEVRARADHVTGSTGEGGLAAALERFVLGGER
ncbi:MAG: Cof-type HAD-IIB family hydrolase [Bacillota bacterium]